MSSRKPQPGETPEENVNLHEKAMQLIRDIAAFAKEKSLNWTPASEPRCCELHSSLHLADATVTALFIAAEENADLDFPFLNNFKDEEVAYFGRSLLERMKEISDAAQTLDCKDCHRAATGTSSDDPALHELILDIGGELLAIRLRKAAGNTRPEDDEREKALKARAHVLRGIINQGGTPQDN